MKISFLILDFNRPKESLLLLRSIKEFVKCDHEILYLSNGGRQDYVLDFYNQKFIDRLLIQKENSGCGAGTDELFRACRTDYAFYVQVDHQLINYITEDTIKELVGIIEEQKYFYVDVSNNQGQGRYSERAQFFNRNTYLSIPRSLGGPGPLSHIKWSEQSVQEYIKEKDLTFYIYKPLLFADTGKWSVREWEDGSVSQHRTDTKILFWLKPPKKIHKDNFYKLTYQEWEEAISGKWPKEGKIPKNKEKDSFSYWR